MKIRQTVGLRDTHPQYPDDDWTAFRYSHFDSFNHSMKLLETADRLKIDQFSIDEDDEGEWIPAYSHSRNLQAPTLAPILRLITPNTPTLLTMGAKAQLDLYNKTWTTI